MLKKTLLLTALSGIFAFCIGIAIDSHTLRLVSKGLPVTALLILLATEERNRYTSLIMCGLACGLVGDLLLEISENLFVPGLLAFLICQLFYITAFLTRSRRLVLLRLLPLLAWGAGTYLLLAPKLKELTVPVVFYLCIFCITIWRAAALHGQAGISRAVGLLALGGAILFWISDFTLAINKFFGPFHYLQYTIILTYWAGQTGIALSVLKDGFRNRSGAPSQATPINRPGGSGRTARS